MATQRAVERHEFLLHIQTELKELGLECGGLNLCVRLAAANVQGDKSISKSPVKDMRMYFRSSYHEILEMVYDHASEMSREECDLDWWDELIEFTDRLIGR